MDGAGEEKIVRAWFATNILQTFYCDSPAVLALQHIYFEVIISLFSWAKYFT